MACTITSAYSKKCREFVGGVKNIYLLQYDQDDAVAATFTDEELSAWNSAVTVYRYELPEGSANYVETVQGSEEGNWHVEQSLTIKLFQLDNDTKKELTLVNRAYLHIFVEDYNGNIVLMGLDSGAYVTGGSQSIGQAKGDLNGYTVEWIAREKGYGTRVADYTTTPLDNIANFTVST